MDRQLLRTLAKTEYKKLMKGTPKSRRMTFAQAFPMIKSMLNAKLESTQLNSSEQLQAEDQALIQGMLEEEPHQHGPDCNHEPVEIEI